MRRSRPSLLELLLTAIPLLGGVVVAVLAVQVVSERPTDDTAWARILLGIALVGWAVAFFAVGRRSDTADDTEPTVRALRPTTVLLQASIVTGGYAILRSWGLPVLAAAVGVVIVMALPVLNRWLDRVIARRERDGDGEQQSVS